MFSKTRAFLSLSLAFFLVLFFFNSVSGQDLAAGQQIFQTNCTSCHKLGSVLVGPDLTGVQSRWKDKKKLHAFIKNPNAFLETDPYVNGLYKKYNAVMAPQSLTDEQIDNVIAYVTTGGGGNEKTASNNAADNNGNGGAIAPAAAAGLFGLTYDATALLLIALFLLLLVIAYTLYRIRTQLRRMGVTTEEQGPSTKQPGWLKRNWEFYKKYTNLTLVGVSIVSILALLGVLDLYDRAQDVGTQINYAPEQPIKFNHKIHAGTYGIKCQYCHTGVDRGKQANIPPLGTCMNCHNYIKEGPQYGKEEIAKLTAAYESKRPVKWIRIHNLPDHVYFNHSQHVVAGKVQCASCHGAVQEMERVRQVSTLEMGWCINCHRETGVDTNNPYYTNTFDFIKKHKKYTVAQLGGIECARCHY